MSDFQELSNIAERLEAEQHRFALGFERLKRDDEFLSMRFVRNMEAIKDRFPSVYEVMKTYQPVNTKIFMEEDGSLNLMNETAGGAIFPENAIEAIDNRLAEFVQKPVRTWLGTGQQADETLSRHEYYMSKLNNIRKKYPQSTSEGIKLGESIGGIVFFGFEFGYQLVKSISLFNAKHIYIYEKNLDFFYYSLFAIEWEEVLEELTKRESTLHFYLGVDSREFIDAYMSDLRFNGSFMASSTYLYLSYNHDDSDLAFEEFKQQYARQVFGWGFFDDAIIGISQFLGRDKKARLLIESSESDKKSKALPVCILGNGPSLDQAIPFIKENIENIIVVSCGTTLNTLYKLGIKPDFHVDVERMRHTAEKFSRMDKSYMEGIIALTVNVMHPHFYDYFDQSIIGLKPGEAISSIMQSGVLGDSIPNNVALMTNSGPIVANTAVSYFLNLGVQEMYLFGVDCGFRDPDRHHSSHSGYFNTKGENSGLATYEEGLMERPANFGGVALTTLIFDASRIQLELALKKHKEKHKRFACYNLSDGIKIKGAEALEVSDILLMSGKTSKQDVINHWLTTRTVEHSPRDYEKQIIALTEKFKRQLVEIENELSKDFNSVDELIEALRKVNSELLKKAYSTDCYIHDLLQGSFTYFANELMTLVFSHKYEQQAITDMITVWCDFLHEMPSMFEKTKDFVDPGRGLLEGKYFY